MKIHFIYPDIIVKFGDRVKLGNRIQMGIASMSACLKANGHTTSLHHVINENRDQELINLVKSEHPDIIAFSSTTNQYPYVKHMCHLLKKQFDLPIIVGGIHATLSPESVISDKNIDIVCIGEGEYPLLDLANNLEAGKGIDSIPNLWIKKEEDVIKNPPRPLIQDLDDLPLHDFDLFDYERVLKRNRRVASFITGRGCPFVCSYCCNHALKRLYKNKGHYVRYRSADRVLEEIEYVTEKYKVRSINFDDDSFTLSKKWISEFCEKYPQKFDLEFECNIRVGTIDIDTLSELRTAGCRKIHIGVECGNESFRRNVLKRDMTNKQIIDVFKDASETGIKTTSFEMFGFPFETREIVEETIAFNKQISPSEIQFSIFYPYPGTDLHNLCEKRGYLRHTSFDSYFETSSTLKLPNLSEQDIKKYYWQFNDFSLKTYVSTNYPWLGGIHKLIGLIFGHRTRGLLIFLKRKMIEIDFIIKSLSRLSLIWVLFSEDCIECLIWTFNLYYPIY